jgi:hypothetical protein
MYELVIGGVSLAIAVGQVYAAPKKERWKTAVVSTVLGCALIVGTLGIQYYRSYQHDRRIEQVASLVWGVMDHPQTFDDIYNRLNYLNYAEVDEAFDVLFENNRSEHKVVEMRSADNEPHFIRLFSRTATPTR